MFKKLISSGFFGAFALVACASEHKLPSAVEEQAAGVSDLSDVQRRTRDLENYFKGDDALVTSALEIAVYGDSYLKQLDDLIFELEKCKKAKESDCDNKKKSLKDNTLNKRSLQSSSRSTPVATDELATARRDYDRLSRIEQPSIMQLNKLIKAKRILGIK